MPTGGGKTLTMIMDAQSSHDVSTTARRQLLLLRVFCWQNNCALSLWRLLILTTAILSACDACSQWRNSSLSTQKLTKFMCMLIVLATWVRTASSLPHTIRSIVSWRQILRSTLFTLTRHITASSVTFSLLLSSLLRTQIAAISTLQPLNIL